MQNYDKKFKYAFFIMKNIKTGKKRITSFHNEDGIKNPSSKLWVPISDRIAYIEVNSREEYLKIKEDLRKKYI